MSAFVVSDRHIDALLYWVINTPRYDAPQVLDGMTVYDQPDLVGQLLVDANERSVSTRYDDEITSHEYKYRQFDRVLSPVEVIKACDCLAYQCCEFSDWKNTKAFRILNAIRESAINTLPEYKTSTWSIA